MIRKLIRAYASEGKIRLNITTWLVNEDAPMGLENVTDTTLHLSVQDAQKLIDELKQGLFEHSEESN